MLDHARAPVLLTQERLLKELPEHRAEVARIVGCSRERRENPPVGRAAVVNLGYVIYMPGSMGEPRGVIVTHANLWHHVRAMQVSLGIAADV